MKNCYIAEKKSQEYLDSSDSRFFYLILKMEKLKFDWNRTPDREFHSWAFYIVS